MAYGQALADAERRIAALEAELREAKERNENSLAALDQNIAAVSRYRARAEGLWRAEALRRAGRVQHAVMADHDRRGRGGERE